MRFGCVAAGWFQLVRSSPYTSGLRWLQTAELLDDTECACQKADGRCYQPVCPRGFYKCCFDCEVSVCDKEQLGYYPSGQLHLSLRGVQECIICTPGDFCEGCDAYAECPADERPEKGKETYISPRISPSGSIMERECQRCPDGYEADWQRDRCVVTGWREKCDLKLMEICVSGCRDNPEKDPCQQMECRIFCANYQGDENPFCIAAHADICEDYNAPLASDTVAPGMMVTTTPSPALLLSDDSGVAIVSSPERSRQCNIRCATAFRGAPTLLWGPLLLGIWLLHHGGAAGLV